MRQTMDRAIWLITGGHIPSVHLITLRRRAASTTQFGMQTPTIQINSYSPRIETDIQILQDKASVNRMAIEGVRPVQNLIPFHLTTLPIKGLTLPSMRVITRIRHFVPRLIVSALNLGIESLSHIGELIQKKVQSRLEVFPKLLTTIIPTPMLTHKGLVFKIEPQKIPRYFTRIRSTPFTNYKPIDVAMRRIGFAKALGVPKDSVSLLAIFKDIEIWSTAGMVYDETSNTLIRHVEEIKDVTSRRCDVVVGRDLRDRKIHIALYKK